MDKRSLQSEGEDLELYREVLYLAAQIDLDPLLQGKIDLSGVIQQTLMEAHAGLPTFRGSSEAEVLSWLRRILANNLIDEVRKLQRVGCDAKLDVSIQDSAFRLANSLSADHTPPDEVAARNEELQLLAAAMAQLPDDQRFAVLRHHLQKITLVEIAREMGRSREAVAGLIHRGMTKLREHMA